MAKILVSLISRQPMPNYIGAKIINPDKMIYFVTRQERVTMERIQKVLKLPFDVIEVKPFDFMSIRDAFLNVVQNHSYDELILNVTGGTKIMALSAFDIASENRIPVIYINTADNEMIQLHDGNIYKHPLPEVVNIPTYLELHGHHFIGSSQPSQLELSQFIGQNYNNLKSILYHLRAIEPGKPYRLPGMITPIQSQILKRLNGIGFIHYDDPKAQIICKQTENVQFIKGGWLEEFVFQQLQCMNPHDIRLNVKVSWKNKGSEKRETKNEFDIMLIRKNQLFIFECKSGKKAMDDIHRLEALREIVGGTYGIAYYLIVGSVSKPILERIKDFKEIRVITEKDLQCVNQLVFI